MASSLKFEIETWAAALEAFDQKDYDTSLDFFSKIADNSKIFFNIGLIHASLGEHVEAVEKFRTATSLDSYMAIAYFQAGVSNFLLSQFEAALADFEDAFRVLRGHEAINYEQIGLKYQLYGAAVLFNQGITLINMGEAERGMQALRLAQAAKVIDDHDVIDEAIQDRGEDYSVFCIPSGVLYRPNEKKIANMRARDWMGKAKLISPIDSKDEFTSFAARVPPVRPDPPSASSSISRSRSAIVASSNSRVPDVTMPTTRVVRSATVGAAYAPRGEDVKRPISPPEVSGPFDLPPPMPLNLPTRSKSVRIADGGSRPPPMARRPTLKLDSNVEFPPSPPLTRTPPRATAELVSSPESKSQRLLRVVNEDNRREDARRARRSNSEGDAKLPLNVPEDVDAEAILSDFYVGYMTEGDEEYYGLKKTDNMRNAKARHRRNGAEENPSLLRPAAPIVPSTPPRQTVTRPTRSNTMPTPSKEVVSAPDPVSTRYSGSDIESGTGTLSGDASEVELIRIRVKLYRKDDIRGMVVAPSIPLPAFLKRVCDKFEKPVGSLMMKFEDEDGTKVSIRDDDDWEMAVSTARVAMGSGGAKGEGKLTVWCEE